MTTTSITTAVDATLTPYTINYLNPVYIQSTGSIFSSSINVVALTVSNGGAVVNDGAIFTMTAAVLMGTNARLTNDGVISTSNDTSIYLTSGSVTVDNAGSIYGGISELNQPSGVTRFELNNSGTISQLNGAAIAMYSGANHIVNSGVIEGYYNGVYLVGNTGNYAASLNLENTGSINSAYQAVYTSIYDPINVTVSNSGSIHGGTYGLLAQEFSPLTAEVSHIHYSNAAGGEISSGSGNAVGVQVTMGDVTINNAGHIWATGNTVYDTLTNSYAGPVINLLAPSVLTNSGLIEATDLVGGVVIDILGTNGAVIHNSGILRGVTAMDLTAVDDKVDNTGRIVGAVLLQDGADQLTSTGVIVGTVDMGAGNDTLDAGGRIRGEVFLGADNDTADLTGALVRQVVHGGSGNDLFIISDTNANLQESIGEGADTVQASSDYTLASGQEIEALQLIGMTRLGAGNEFANTITGNAADNSLSGNAGADTLSGGAGNDRSNGGTESDNLSGGTGDDSQWGDAGADVVNGNGGNDALYGQADNDTLNGGDGEDALYGGLGNDSLVGSTGDDVLVGGKGTDTLVGGADDDTFVFLRLADSGKVASLTADLISDFSKGNDSIDLSRIDADRNTTADDHFAYIKAAAFSGVAGQLHYTVSGGNMVLEGDVDGDGTADFQIQLSGVTSIYASDLIL